MAFTFKIKKRCRFCGTVLREDGTCPDKKCPRYVPEKTEAVEEPKQDSTADGGK
jgi:phage FluMu protein Com